MVGGVEGQNRASSARLACVNVRKWECVFVSGQESRAENGETEERAALFAHYYHLALSFIWERKREEVPVVRCEQVCAAPTLHDRQSAQDGVS